MKALNKRRLADEVFGGDRDWSLCHPRRHANDRGSLGCSPTGVGCLSPTSNLASVRVAAPPVSRGTDPYRGDAKAESPVCAKRCGGCESPPACELGSDRPDGRQHVDRGGCLRSSARIPKIDANGPAILTTHRVENLKSRADNASVCVTAGVGRCWVFGVVRDASSNGDGISVVRTHAAC